MSKRKIKPFLFQSLKGKTIKYSSKEKSIIQRLSPLTGGEWAGPIKGNSSGVKGIDRNDLVRKIKEKLIQIQGEYCIYCGLHEQHCGNLEREHIAPKGTKLYPHFMFEPQNLALACHHCNFELKKDFDTISIYSSNYNMCEFNIVHPYLDEFDKHIQFAIDNGRALIKAAQGSVKGRRTIDLFELDSVPKTDKRSGLLIVSTIKIDKKYDSLLTRVLNKKYIK